MNSNSSKNSNVNIVIVLIKYVSLCHKYPHFILFNSESVKTLHAASKGGKVQHFMTELNQE